MRLSLRRGEMETSAFHRDTDPAREPFRLGAAVALRAGLDGLPQGLVGRIVGYYPGADGVELAVSFEPVDRLLRLTRHELEPLDLP
jgi:hypothetical protein